MSAPRVSHHREGHLGAASSDGATVPLAGGPMLLGVVAAATAPVAPWAANLACRLADPFLLALIAVARWAADLPGGTVTLAGPARVAPVVVVVALGLLTAARRRRSPS